MRAWRVDGTQNVEIDAASRRVCGKRGARRGRGGDGEEEEEEEEEERQRMKGDR